MGWMIFLGQEELVGALYHIWDFSCVVMCEVTSYWGKFSITLEVNESCEKSSIRSLWKSWPCWGTPKLVELIIGWICKDRVVGNASCSCGGGYPFEAFWLGDVDCPCMVGSLLEKLNWSEVPFSSLAVFCKCWSSWWVAKLLLKITSLDMIFFSIMNVHKAINLRLFVIPKKYTFI